VLRLPGKQNQEIIDPDLAEYVRLVESGDPVPAKLSEVVAEFVRQKAPKKRGRREKTGHQADRELRIALEVAQGGDIGEVADAYGISERSVQNYVTRQRDMVKQLFRIARRREAMLKPILKSAIRSAAMRERVVEKSRK